jgi:acyl dehydratase
MSAFEMDDNDSVARPRSFERRKIDEETLGLVRRRIGIPSHHTKRSHNEECSSDSFRHYAKSYGDDNPLYCEPGYAEQTVWGGLIAPPMYPITAGVPVLDTWTDEQRETMTGGDPLAGIGQYMCGERWLFLRPIRPHADLERVEILQAAELKESSFGGGVGALLSHQVSWRDGEDQLYALRFLDFWHADREHSAQSAKYRNIKRSVYTDEDLARIDASYESEYVRGREPRLVNDVAVGDELGPIVKGPLCVADVMSYHIGIGWGSFGGGSAKIAYKARRRIPKFYFRNEFGYWDSAQRCHWEDSWAQHLGQPAAYDYGAMRTNWMVHLITNWMGDGAWLWKMSASVIKFNYVGDTHWMTGEITAIDVPSSTVEIEVKGTNQRGEVTCLGSAVVILPTDSSHPAQSPPYDPADVPAATAP